MFLLLSLFISCASETWAECECSGISFKKAVLAYASAAFLFSLTGLFCVESCRGFW